MTEKSAIDVMRMEQALPLFSFDDHEGSVRRRHLTSIVVAATAWNDSGRAYDTGIACQRERRGDRCRGFLRVARDVPRAEIRWRCRRCGEEGLLVNWQDTDGDMRRNWPLPPWSVAPVPGMFDDYVRMEVGRWELTVLQTVSMFEKHLWNVVYAARRRRWRFIVVGPDTYCRDLRGFLLAMERKGDRIGAVARRLRRRLAEARWASRARRQTCPDDVADRQLELGEGPFAN